MPDPHDVNPHNFKVQEVVYNRGGFSIAWGIEEPGRRRLGMRWNGSEDRPAGYPNHRGFSAWFMLPDELVHPILEAIKTVTSPPRSEQTES